MSDMSETSQTTHAGAVPGGADPEDHGMKRSIGWQGGFWIASGVPALLLFSIGSIAATVGVISPMIWAISVILALLQSFVFAEIAGLFPQKSGGTSVFGAMAWAPYSKFVAPLSVWCNWLAWSPVLSIGSGLAAGYVITAMFPEDAAISTWSIELLDLGFLNEGMQLRINATFIIAAILLLLVFALQHGGILRAARVQTVIGIAVLFPLLIVGLVPLLTGDIAKKNFTPFEPFSGAWDQEGLTLVAGGLFLAAWSAYAFETAICYTSEFKDPGRDTPKAIFAAGGLCLVTMTLVPLSFQGALGVDALQKPGIVDGDGVGAAMAGMIGGGTFITNLVIVMLILALLLTIMTTMAGSSRTLYQGSKDGWLPRYLGRTNHNGAPTRAMWTDLVFNLVLLLMSDYVFVLASSTVCYMMFNFLNLNAGWIHRIDRADAHRPWRAPTVMIGLGAVFAFFNALLLGWGSNTWGSGTLLTGVGFAAVIIPVFCYRHFIQDKGVFPDSMYAPAEIEQPDGSVVTTTTEAGPPAKKAGLLPYFALAGGVAVVAIGQILANGG